jgi:hypothetical protein
MVMGAIPSYMVLGAVHQVSSLFIMFGRFLAGRGPAPRQTKANFGVASLDTLLAHTGDQKMRIVITQPPFLREAERDVSNCWMTRLHQATKLCHRGAFGVKTPFSI